MNVTQLKEAILLCRESNVTPFIWGKHGIGKSSAVLQLSQVMEVGMVDMRCSQLEASDLRGLPEREGGRTLYLPPADLPNDKQCSPSCTLFRESGCKHKVCIEREKAGETACRGFLFLDELNRAEDDVLQAAFQLVYDKAIGTYKLPSGWSVVVAGNYTEGYTVNSFNDPAFLDRFCHVDLTIGEPYYADWTDFMKRNCGEAADKILQFVGFNDVHLMAKTEADRGFAVTPSPRSWELVARVENVSRAQNFDRMVVQEVMSGIIGRELALQFERFATDVLPSDIINRFSDVEAKVARMSRNQMIGLVWGVVSNAKDIGKLKDPEKKMENVLDFLTLLAKHKERDTAVMLARQLCEGETKSLGGAVVSNPHLAKMAARFKQKKGGGKTWIAAINERQDLQALMSKVAFGNE
jgi:MoxR-like ATPase